MTFGKVVGNLLIYFFLSLNLYFLCYVFFSILKHCSLFYEVPKQNWPKCDKISHNKMFIYKGLSLFYPNLYLYDRNLSVCEHPSPPDLFIPNLNISPQRSHLPIDGWHGTFLVLVGWLLNHHSPIEYENLL